MGHIKERPTWFHRFEVGWTPTVLLLDSDARERVRLEGYLTNRDFLAALESGLGRIAFVHKRHADAEHWYGEVLAGFGDTHFAPAAMYWQAVARYSATFDHEVLARVAAELRNRYPSSMWSNSAMPWLPAANGGESGT